MNEGTETPKNGRNVQKRAVSRVSKSDMRKAMKRGVEEFNTQKPVTAVRKTNEVNFAVSTLQRRGGGVEVCSAHS